MNAEVLMHEAIAVTGGAWGRTHPNPVVGAVIFHCGEVVARGCTEAPGGRHAEIVALQEFASRGLVPDASTCLVVTLEPCCTQGRTGPCSDAIVNSGIRRVVVGTLDPNPLHDGEGIVRMRAAGIEVEVGVLEARCRDLNLIFNHWIRKQEPFIAAKVATTIDGRIATRGGLSKWITGVEAREDVMRWRRYFPAIAVGAGTVIADNPSLTVRESDTTVWTPKRFVFDRNLITFRDALPKLYTDNDACRTVVVTTENRKIAAETLSQKFGLQIWALPEESGDGGLHAFVRSCAESGITGVYVEGGAQLLSGFLRCGRLDYLFCYRAPRLLADSAALAPFFGREPATMDEAIMLRDVRHESFGDDQLMRGHLVL